MQQMHSIKQINDMKVKDQNIVVMIFNGRLNENKIRFYIPTFNHSIKNDPINFTTTYPISKPIISASN